MLPLDFLWDEEKTRRLFRTHLILFAIGASLGLIYSFILPSDNPYRTVTIAVPTLFILTIPFYFLTLNWSNPGVRFLIFTLESQLAASIFMAVTGGFVGIVQFAPYMFLLFTVFQLGTNSTIVLGLFTILNFVAVLFWSYFYNPYPTLFQDFFYYVGSYALIVIIERNIGKELTSQFEAKKRLEQVDDLKNQFISITSHYLRTPVSIIKAFISKLEKGSPQAGGSTNLESIKSTVHGLELLIENLLIISSIEKGETKITPQVSNIDKLLQEIGTDFQPDALRAWVSLYVNIPAKIPDFPFDPSKLKRAISNLVDNAIKYNKSGGKVTLSAQVQGKSVVIRVSDSGIGIHKDSLPTLFSPFSKGSMKEVLNFARPGVGLSLYITKLIIDAHGGTIVAQSQENVGSVFTVTLPLAP